MIHVRPDDRVLLLTVPASAEVRALAGQLRSGLVVCLAGPEDLHRLRRDLHDLENVMGAPASDDGAISWKEGFFSVVVADGLTEPSTELLRVSAPGATIHLAGGGIIRR